MRKTEIISLGSLLIALVMLANWVLYLYERVVLLNIGKQMSALFFIISFSMSAVFFFVFRTEIVEEKIKGNAALQQKQDVNVIINNETTINSEKVNKNNDSADDRILPKKVLPKINITAQAANMELNRLKKQIDIAERNYVGKLRVNPESEDTKLAFAEYESLFYKIEELLSGFKGNERYELKRDMLKKK